ncbi:Catenin-beta-like protein, partial [Dimargaris cristalligena]
ETDSPASPHGDSSEVDDNDEEDHRFYGDGFSDQQREILDFRALHGAVLSDETDPELTLPAIRRLTLQLERAINKNQELRARYPDTPAKFMESEIDLEHTLHRFVNLSQAPQQFTELAQLDTIPLLLSQLSHENTDVAAIVVEVFNEWTDEETVFNAIPVISGEELDQEAIHTLVEQERATAALIEAVNTMVGAFISNQGLELVVQNLGRLQDDRPEDQAAIFQTLGLIEHLTELRTTYVTELVERTAILSWLLNVIAAGQFSSNLQYASEILVIILQGSPSNQIRLGALGGIDTILQALSVYRQRDPDSGDEIEYMENLFDILCLMIGEPELKLQFLKNEGVELMILMLKAKLLSRSRALKVLNFATCTNHFVSKLIAQKFIEESGLVPIMKVFMKKVGIALHSPHVEHTISVIASLLKHTEPATPDRWRVVNQFPDSGYERVDRLVELHMTYTDRLQPVEAEIAAEREALNMEDAYEEEYTEERFYTRRLTEGLFVVHMTDLVLVYLASEAPRIKQHATMLLKRYGRQWADVCHNVEGKSQRLPNWRGEY